MSANENIFKSHSRNDVEASASRVEKVLTGKFISKKECLKSLPTWLVGLIALVRKYLFYHMTTLALHNAPFFAFIGHTDQTLFGAPLPNQFGLTFNRISFAGQTKSTQLLD